MTSFYKSDAISVKYLATDKMATKGKQMSTPMKNAIITMSESGYTQQDIAAILSVSQSGISKFL